MQATPSENLHLPEDFYDSLKDVYAERFYHARRFLASTWIFSAATSIMSFPMRTSPKPSMIPSCPCAGRLILTSIRCVP